MPNPVLEHDDVVDVVDLRQGTRPEPLAAGPDALVVAAKRLDAPRVADRFGEFVGNHARTLPAVGYTRVMHATAIAAFPSNVVTTGRRIVANAATSTNSLASTGTLC